MAVLVILSGVIPNRAFSATPEPGQRSRTIAQIASAEYFDETADYDEVIVTVGDNDDYIFKTGATETIISRNNRSGTIVYEAKQGESVASIARDFGLSPDTVNYANKTSGSVTPGQKLKIPPTDGIFVAVAKNDTLSTIARRYKVSVDDVTKFNNLDSSQPIFSGQELLIPGVVAPKAASTPSAGGGRGTTTISPSGVSPSIVPEGTGQFIWPLQSATHYISQGYRGGHQALDLNKLNGRGIYASAAGVVTTLGGRTGYGNHIDIRHGGGWMTRYAHLSEFKVKNGEYVQQGQLIGIMGSTGRSTGIHLHFEIRLNDRPVNPLSYLPK